MMAKLFLKVIKSVRVLYIFSLFVPVYFLALPVEAREYYVDPNVPQSAKSNGTKETPWSNLNTLISSNTIKPGDRINLLDGYYGTLTIQNQKPEIRIFISVLKGHKARFNNVKIRASENWALKGLSVSPSYAEPYSKRKIVRIDDSKNIRIENFDIFSVPDTTKWTDKDWNEKSLDGIFAYGSSMEIIDNRLKNVAFGITVSAENSTIIGNEVINFSGDGLRGLKNYNLFERNIVKNCYQVNGNHADGFQSWTTGPKGTPGKGEIIGTILRRNLIINYEDENQPYRCKMQGIGMFGGLYVDWVIENNIVITDHWHGITVYGAKNVRILNNTLLDPNNRKPGPAWITLTAGKRSGGNLIANNLASSFKFPKSGVVQLNNQVIRDPQSLFVDADKYDLRLKNGSRAINAGMPGLGVTEDFFGNPRPVGKGIDIGAIEKQD